MREIFDRECIASTFVYVWKSEAVGATHDSRRTCLYAAYPLFPPRGGIPRPDIEFRLHAITYKGEI